MNIDPRYLSVTQWTDAMRLQLEGRSAPPRLDDPNAWADWALIVVQAPRIAKMNPPDPRKFLDWRDWASRFNQAVPLIR